MKTTIVKRILKWLGIIGSLCGFLWVIPKPLWGYWHTAYSDCLCSSKYLIQFRDGTVYRWALAHNTADEPYGTYRRSWWWVYWDTGKEIVRLRPGLILMDVRALDDDHRKFGMREWRSDYIDDVLGYRKKVWTSRILSRGTFVLKSDTDSLSFTFLEAGKVLCTKGDDVPLNLTWSIDSNRLVINNSDHSTKFEYYIMSGKGDEIAVHDDAEKILIFRIENEPNK